MNEDLYSPNQTTTQEVVQTTVTNTVSNATPILETIEVLMMYGIIFAFVWTVFYSILFTCDFFFYRVKYHDNEVVREKKGVESIFKAVRIWSSFSLVLIVLWIHQFTPPEFKLFTGILSLLAILFKVLIEDMPDIPFLGTLLGKPGKKWDGLTTGLLTFLGGFVSEFFKYVSTLFGGSSS